MALLFPGLAPVCETYGIKDPQGSFIPKVSITVGNKDVVIKKIDPHDKFRSFSITLNPKNQKLVRNVGLIDLEWIDANNQPGRPVQFARTPLQSQDGGLSGFTDKINGFEAH